MAIPKTPPAKIFAINLIVPPSVQETEPLPDVGASRSNSVSATPVETYVTDRNKDADKLQFEQQLVARALNPEPLSRAPNRKHRVNLYLGISTPAKF